MGMGVQPSRSTLQGPVTVNGALSIVNTAAGTRALQIQQAAGQVASPVAVTDSTGTIVEFAIGPQTGGVRPGSSAGTVVVTGTIFYGTGAPNNANGADGDMYLRTDGAALTTIYQRRAGAWVGIV